MLTPVVKSGVVQDQALPLALPLPAVPHTAAAGLGQLFRLHPRTVLEIVHVVIVAEEGL